MFWRDDNLYRGIRPEHAHFYRSLLNKGVIQGLIEKGLLIDTWAVDDSTDEFPLILQHRVIPTVTFPAEWCQSHFKAAALIALDLEIAARRHDFTVSDINPWNVLFDNVHPYFVDLSRIIPISETAGKHAWLGQQQFYEFYLNPLSLFRQGLSRVARRMLYDPAQGISADERIGGLKNLTPFREWAYQGAKRLAKTVIPVPLHAPVGRAVRKLVSRAPNRIDVSADFLPKIIALREKVAALDQVTSSRAGYYDDNFPEFTPSERWTAKHHSIFRILTEARPKTVFDIGSNRGWYAQLAAHCGARVIAADRDERSLNDLYKDATNSHLAITPVYMDVRFPEPAQGPGYHMMPAASERFRSEMVFALALVHHLVFWWQMSFEQISETLAMFTSRWLAVEFIGPEDEVVRRYGGANSECYRLDKFVASLSRYFNVIKHFPSDWGGLPYRDGSGATACDRTILFCERKLALEPNPVR